MQPATSIGSKVTWFIVAVAILVVTCLIGLHVLPMCREVSASFGASLPTGTRLAFALGPPVLVSVGVIAAMLMVMGEFTPALRGMRTPLILLVVVLLGLVIGAVRYLPFSTMHCTTVSVTSATDQSTNGPKRALTAHLSCLQQPDAAWLA